MELLAGLVGVLLGGAATFGGVVWAQHAETEREDKREERAARRAQQERLRNAYGSLLAAAYEGQRLIGALGITYVDKSRSSRISDLMELARQSPGDVGQATVTLTLEGEEEVLKAYRAVHDRAWRLQMGILLELAGTHVLPSERVQSALEGTIEDVKKLEKLAQDRLARLDPVLPPRSS